MVSGTTATPDRRGIDTSNLGEDRDVVGPFIARLMERLRERHPGVTPEDVSLHIVVDLPVEPRTGPSLEIYRMLRDMADEGVVV